jgi:hypothetical protein
MWPHNKVKLGQVLWLVRPHVPRHKDMKSRIGRPFNQVALEALTKAPRRSLVNQLSQYTPSGMRKLIGCLKFVAFTLQYCVVLYYPYGSDTVCAGGTIESSQHSPSNEMRVSRVNFQISRSALNKVLKHK